MQETSADGIGAKLGTRYTYVLRRTALVVRAINPRKHRFVKNVTKENNDAEVTARRSMDVVLEILSEKTLSSDLSPFFHAEDKICLSLFPISFSRKDPVRDTYIHTYVVHGPVARTHTKTSKKVYERSRYTYKRIVAFTRSSKSTYALPRQHAFPISAFTLRISQ